ncbi:MAG: transglycosylase SLT domain-containing protein [Salinivirgaceae bacterium]|nr:transglycosylase SLT domain-containing protein [Salinivirgaceae bacterium]MDD4746141.1 transglycosylase SLT domain-containing protein [Salinivirgaceae bacterium]MDY0279917.1 transglycosylase SLT domain-containing protein [Salinivirgaceae bacterium]
MQSTLLIAFLGTIINLYNPSIKNDSVKIEQIFMEQKLKRDYDSLLLSYYVKSAMEDTSKTIGDTLFVSDITIDSTALPKLDINDSVIMRQMAEMPVLFDVSYNPIVKSFIEVYSHRKRELTSTVLGLSEYYFPIFEKELDAANLPMELKYLAVIESALNPRAVSRAGATGLWQFMYATGRYMGLEISSFVDERRDVVLSTKAAIKYLTQLHSIYNDWTLALAAYNCGPGNVNKAIRRSGGSTNYWEIYYRLPKETRNYVPGFIAAMYVMEHHNDFNITAKEISMPALTDTILIHKQLHLEQVSTILNLPLSQLRDLNPQYRRDILPATSKIAYPLRLPFEYATRFIDLQDSIYGYKDSIFFNPETLAATPVRGSQYGAPPTKNHTALNYTVAYGDNLGFIANWFNVSINDIREWNNIYKNVIRAGQKLLIYVPKSKYNYYNELNSLDFAAKQKRVGISTTNSPKTPIPNYPDDDKYIFYTLKRGDTLWDVAKKYEGVSDRDLLKINGLVSGKDLKPGQQIRIKRLE